MFKKLLLASALIGALSVPAFAGDYAEKSTDTATEAAAQVEKNIVETAIGNEQFSTLVSALKAAELVDALSGPGPFTVFAPTNEAFSALPAGTLEDLLKPENKEKLQSILKYHVISGNVKSADIADGTTAVTTLQGTTADVTKGAEGVKIDNAKVTTADVATSNGVIHIIDAVITP